MSDDKKKYYGKMCADKTILWAGPMTKEEMEEDCDIFRHNITYGKPTHGKIISKEEAIKVTENQLDDLD